MMLIYCPKCSTGYEIDENLIKDKSRKVRCSHCNEVFEASNLIKKSVDNIDIMEDISEENAFNALAAMMRDADIFNEEDSSVLDNEEDSSVLDNNDDIDENDEKDNAVGVFVSSDEAESGLEDKNKDNMTEDDNLSDDSLSENLNDDKKLDTVSEDENALESEDVNKEDNKTVESDEVAISIDSIYERLSEHTSNLIERENALPIYEKIWFKIKDVLGFHFKIKWSYIFIALFVFVSLSLFNNRYEVVRKFPFMNGVYKTFGIKAKIAGEGLEFQNVIWEYVEDEGVRKLELKGFINNITSSVIAIPVVHVEILDKNTLLLQSFNQKLNDKEIASGNRIPLQMVVENPAPNAKYVYFTFIDEE